MATAREPVKATLVSPPQCCKSTQQWRCSRAAGKLQGAWPPSSNPRGQRDPVIVFPQYRPGSLFTGAPVSPGVTKPGERSSREQELGSVPGVGRRGRSVLSLPTTYQPHSALRHVTRTAETAPRRLLGRPRRTAHGSTPVALARRKTAEWTRTASKSC